VFIVQVHQSTGEQRLSNKPSKKSVFSKEKSQGRAMGDGLEIIRMEYCKGTTNNQEDHLFQLSETYRTEIVTKIEEKLFKVTKG
jgi:hypothetical protein